MPRRQAEYNPSYIQISKTETTVARGDAKVQGGWMVSEKKEERIPLRFAFNCIKNIFISGGSDQTSRDFLFFFFFSSPVDES